MENAKNISAKKTYKKVKVIEKPLLEIRYDECSESPREWSNLGYFITCDRSYSSPDKNEEIESIVKETGQIALNTENHMELIKKRIESETNEKVLKIYPVVKYEHGNISYSLGVKHGFDYSNNGFYIITDKTQKEIGTEKEDFEKVIESEIKIYNKWCNGEVYGFALYDKNGESEDSCWGFYEIEDIRAQLPKEWENEDLEEYFIA